MGIDPRFSHLRVTPRYLIRTYLLTVGTVHITPPLPKNTPVPFLGPAFLFLLLTLGLNLRKGRLTRYHIEPSCVASGL
jgi:hypothetical protein